MQPAGVQDRAIHVRTYICREQGKEKKQKSSKWSNPTRYMARPFLKIDLVMGIVRKGLLEGEIAKLETCRGSNRSGVCSSVPHHQK